MDSLESIGRMAASLVAVLGLLWLITRGMRRSRAAAANSEEVAVLSRQAVGHKAGVAVVKVGTKALIVGVTEQQVTLLSQVPLDVVTAKPTEERTTVAIPGVSVPAPAATPAVENVAPGAGALSGSALSPATWTKAVDVLRERTTRR
ncbi:FliO/MopB family protein [Kineococcus gynurae]|uniref:FliO/MopB family protein n=1 Tax=Kineococcus gynurae TaxID=452979 RepID=A0ABV5LR63_9ACTN